MTGRFRKQVVIATKFGFDLRGSDTRPGAAGLNSRPEHIKQAVEGSLKRLKVERIDLRYQHRVDPNVPIQDVAGAVKELILSLGTLNGFDNTCFNGVEVGRTDMTTANGSQTPRDYVVPGKLVKPGKNVIAVRLFNRFGPGGFAGKPGFSVGPDGDRSGRQSAGPRVGLEMSLSPKPRGTQCLTYYHPDYRTDFHMGDNPYRYYR